MKISDELERDYIEKFIGKKVMVLIETNDDNMSIGHTGNYLQVIINKKIEKNTLVDVLIKRRIDNYLEGEIYEGN